MEEGKANNNNSVNEENPSNNDMVDVNNGNNNDSTNEGRGGAGGRRRPFTDLSQVDADLALARTLQEQVLHACIFMLRYVGCVTFTCISVNVCICCIGQF